MALDVERVVLALAGADDLEGEVPGVVDEDLGLDRLVAAAHGVDAPELSATWARSAPMVTSDSTLRVASPCRRQRLERHPGAHVGHPRGLDHDVERQPTELVDTDEGDGLAVLDGLDRLVRRGGVRRREPGLAERVLGPVRLDVEHGGQGDARHPEQLGSEAAAHLPGADEPDPERAAGLLRRC